MNHTKQAMYQYHVKGTSQGATPEEAAALAVLEILRNPTKAVVTLLNQDTGQAVTVKITQQLLDHARSIQVKK